MSTTPRPARTLRALLLILCTALGILLSSAGPADAHAELRATDPEDGAVVKTAPKYVTLTFTEDVRLPDGALRVLDPSGARMDKGTPGHVPGQAATARVGLSAGLAQGTYTVAWRVVSADSHPVSGAFTFSVGKPSATSAKVPTGDEQDVVVGTLYGVGRFTAYGGLALMAGAAAFVLLCRPPSGTGTAALRRRLRKLLVTGWWVLVASTAVLLALRGPYEAGVGMSGVWDTEALGQALGGRPGQALAARLVLLLGAGAAWRIPALRRRAAAAPVPGGLRRGGLVAGAGFAVALAATWAAAEHASVGPQAPLAMVFAGAHLLGMAVWLGGLTAVLVLLRPSSGGPGREQPVAPSVDRFSRLAFTAVTVLVATGIYQSWREVGSWRALVSTPYGQALAVKVTVVLALLAAAGVSRRWTARLGAAPAAAPVRVAAAGQARGGTVTASPPVTAPPPPPDTRGLRRSVAVEAGLAVIVLAVTTVLTGTQPARTAVASAKAGVLAPSDVGLALADINVAFDTGGPGGKGRVNLALEPGRVGRNSLRVVVFDPQDGLLNPPEVRVSLTQPSRGVGPLDAALTHTGTVWLADSVNVPFPGKWRLDVTVRTSEIDEVTVTKTVTVPGAS